MSHRQAQVNILLLVCGSLILGSCAPDGGRRRAATVQVSGQVFIVTRGRENVRLGLVTVAAIPTESLLVHFERRRHAWHDGPIVGIQTQIDQTEELVAAQERLAHPTAEQREANTSAYIRGDIGSAEWYGGPYGVVATAQARIAKLKAQLAALRVQLLQEPSASFLFEGLPRATSLSKTDADGRFELSLYDNSDYALVAEAARETPAGVENYHWAVRVPETARHGMVVLLSNDNLVTASGTGSLVAAQERQRGDLGAR